MLYASVLGRVYDIWCLSRCYAFLQAIFRFFSNAFASSTFLRLMRREPPVERIYRSSLLMRALDGLFDLLFKGLGRICRRLSPLVSSSVALRWLSGSIVCDFDFLLGAFLCGMFLVPHDFWSNSYALLGGAAFLLLYLLLVAAGKRKILRFSELGLPAFFFALACVFSLAYSLDRSDTVRVLMFYISAYLLLYLAAAEARESARLQKLMGFLWLAVIGTALYAIYQRFVGVAVSTSFTDLSINKGVPGRVYSTLDNPNNYAEFLVLFTPLSVAWAMRVKNPTLRVVCTCCLAFPLIALLMTYSRSGWISMLLAAGVFVYYANKKTIPLFLMVGIACIPLLPDSVITRFSTLFMSRDSSNTYRLYIWQSAIRMIRDYFPTGIGLGPGSFEQIYQAYAHTLATEGVPHAHMVWLEVFLETGLLGIVSLLWLLLRTVKDTALAIRRNGEDRRWALIAGLAGLIGISFGCCVEYVWYYPRVLFAWFLLLGLCLGAAQKKQA